MVKDGPNALDRHYYHLYTERYMHVREEGVNEPEIRSQEAADELYIRMIGEEGVPEEMAEAVLRHLGFSVSDGIPEIASVDRRQRNR